MTLRDLRQIGRSGLLAIALALGVLAVVAGQGDTDDAIAQRPEPLRVADLGSTSICVEWDGVRLLAETGRDSSPWQPFNLPAGHYDWQVIAADPAHAEPSDIPQEHEAFHLVDGTGRILATSDELPDDVLENKATGSIVVGAPAEEIMARHVGPLDTGNAHSIDPQQACFTPIPPPSTTTTTTQAPTTTTTADATTTTTLVVVETIPSTSVPQPAMLAVTGPIDDQWRVVLAAIAAVILGGLAVTHRPLES